MVMLKREYVVPLRRRARSAPKWRRSKKAVSVLKDFIRKHMKADEIVICSELNEQIWKNGAKNPPGKVSITVVKDKIKEKEVTIANLASVGIDKQLELYDGPQKTKDSQEKAQDADVKAQDADVKEVGDSKNQGESLSAKDSKIEQEMNEEKKKIEELSAKDSQIEQEVNEEKKKIEELSAKDSKVKQEMNEEKKKIEELSAKDSKIEQEVNEDDKQTDNEKSQTNQEIDNMPKNEANAKKEAISDKADLNKKGVENDK